VGERTVVVRARRWELKRGRRIARVLPLLVSVPLLACALSATSSAHAVSASPTRACGRLMVDGWPVSKVRVTNLTCARARRLMVHYHKTGHGLSCFTFSDDVPIHIRCKARVAVTRPGASRRRRRFVEAVIAFSLPDCAAAGDCGD
jgi:hypothetical protein